jgi:hypothetical protein
VARPRSSEDAAYARELGVSIHLVKRLGGADKLRALEMRVNLWCAQVNLVMA